jgi:hypothetical protein
VWGQSLTLSISILSAIEGTEHILGTEPCNPPPENDGLQQTDY